MAAPQTELAWPEEARIKVRDLIVRDVLTLRRHDSLDALMTALEGTQDIIPVLDARDRVVGTVGEQDLVRTLGPAERTFPFGPSKLIAKGLVHEIEDVMTPRPSTARLDEPVEAALKRMAAMELPQLVVVDDRGRFVGLVRGRDIYRALVSRER